MSNFGLYVVSGILGIAINIGVVYYLANFTAKETKSTALSVILSLIFGPLIGYAYARPKAWTLGLIAELFFFAPIAIGGAVLIGQGSVAIGGAMVGYLAVAVAATAVFITQDQNDQFGSRESLA